MSRLARSTALLALSLFSCASEPTSRWVKDPSSTQGARTRGAILFVMTAADEQILRDGSKRPTGYFLGEFYEAYRAVKDAGYEVAFASPGGERPPVDPESLKEKYWEEHPDWRDEASRFVERDERMRAPLSLEEALTRQQEFEALVVPGGQGVMIDLLEDERAHELIVKVGSSHRPVGLICHAPALLTRLPANAPFQGRRVTSVSWTEELFIETFVMGARAQERDIGGRLSERGFRHEAAFPGSGNAVRDCNLVTSQNPFSGAEFSALFLEALEDFRQGGHCEASGG